MANKKSKQTSTRRVKDKLISKFTKDIYGRSVNLEGNADAFAALRASEDDECVVVNVDDRSLAVTLCGGGVHADKNGKEWLTPVVLANLPIHSDDTPFYESGNGFPVEKFPIKEAFVERVYEEYANHLHGSYMGIEMHRSIVPDIADGQNAVNDAIERGLEKRAGFKVEIGRTRDGSAFNDVVILRDDMSESDREYCRKIANGGGLETIYSNDAPEKKYHVTQQQIFEIRAIGSIGYPIRDYMGTLERAVEQGRAKGVDTSEFEQKIAERREFEDSDRTPKKNGKKSFEEEYVSANEIAEAVTKLEEKDKKRGVDRSNEVASTVAAEDEDDVVDEIVD